MWTATEANRCILRFDHLETSEQKQLIGYLNEHFPPERYEQHRRLRAQAIDNMTISRHLLEGARQEYPAVIDAASTESDPRYLRGCAIVFTAGGEGERLRLSLLTKGVPATDLVDFTKATYPLPDFYKNFGALQTNLCALASYCYKHSISVPIIITTGPEHSTTARVIPRIVHENSFGLSDIKIIAQEERLHLTADEQIAWIRTDAGPRPVTQPDETGGPLVKLTKPSGPAKESAIDWLKKKNCNRILVLQGTALYDLHLIVSMAAGARGHDCLGVGIARESFPDDDPYGTFVTITRNDRHSLNIVEPAIRNEETRRLRDPETGRHLPYNTGFYAIDLSLLSAQSLPDYATPPKEVLPGIPRSPKVGYAATDLVSLASNPAVLTIDTKSYGVLKKSDDLKRLSTLGKRLGLDRICAQH